MSERHFCSLDIHSLDRQSRLSKRLLAQLVSEFLVLTAMQDSESVECEFPQSIGKVARRELGVHGFTRYDQLTEVSAAHLLKLHGIGPKAIRILAEELNSRGLSFR